MTLFCLPYAMTQFYEGFRVWKKRQKSFGNALFSNLPNKNILGIFSVKLRNWEKVNKFSVSRIHILSRVGLEPWTVNENYFSKSTSCQKILFFKIEPTLTWTESDSENVAKTTAMILWKVNLATAKVKIRICAKENESRKSIALIHKFNVMVKYFVHFSSFLSIWLSMYWGNM